MERKENNEEIKKKETINQNANLRSIPNVINWLSANMQLF